MINRLLNFGKNKDQPRKKQQVKTLQTETPSMDFFDLDTGKCDGVPATLPEPIPAKEAILEDFREHIQDVPALPTIWSEIQESINSGDSARFVADIIRKDQGLATVVLKAVNSKNFDNDKEVSDINRAIVLLGFQALRGIVINYCTGDFSHHWRKPFNIQLLWKHSMAVSTLSVIVAKYIRGCDAGLAGTLGLLHDIGRLGLNSICQDRFRYPPDPEEGFLSFEREHFGCTHVEAGILLAEHWQLPGTVQQGIRFHHHPGYEDINSIPDDIRSEVLAVYLADFLAIHFGFNGGNKLLVKPHDSFAPMLKAPLNKIAHVKAVSKELWRIHAIDL